MCIRSPIIRVSRTFGPQWPAAFPPRVLSTRAGARLVGCQALRRISARPPAGEAPIPKFPAVVDNGRRSWLPRREGRLILLTLYARRDCHLCADMHRDLLALETRRPISVALVDIDTDADLVQRYGHKVPVLVAGDEEICHYFLDEPQLDAYLSRIE